MHIPPYHKKRSWQIFFVGTFIGVIIGYMIIMYMFGKMYEDIISREYQLQTELEELENQNEALLEDKEDLQEQVTPTILIIDITFLNSEDLHVDRLTTHELEDLLRKELQSVIGKTVDSVTENEVLLIRHIENKTFTVDNLSYTFEVKRLSISSKLKLSIDIQLAD